MKCEIRTMYADCTAPMTPSEREEWEKKYGYKEYELEAVNWKLRRRKNET